MSKLNEIVLYIRPLSTLNLRAVVVVMAVDSFGGVLVAVVARLQVRREAQARLWANQAWSWA